MNGHEWSLHDTHIMGANDTHIMACIMRMHGMVCNVEHELAIQFLLLLLLILLLLLPYIKKS